MWFLEGSRCLSLLEQGETGSVESLLNDRDLLGAVLSTSYSNHNEEIAYCFADYGQMVTKLSSYVYYKNQVE